MEDPRLLVSVRTASYAVPEGLVLSVTHADGCDNGSRDFELLQCVRMANPKVMPEMVTAAKAVMAVMGCPEGCKIDKAGSDGILHRDHSQDSSFVASGTSLSTTGTGSLVGERLVEGVQGTQTGKAEVTVGCISQFSSSWPTDLGVGSSERGLYKVMKLDRSSDDDYVPSRVVVDDVAMSLGDNKTSELTGLGDSQHAHTVEDVVGGSLPSTVPYSVSATQDILCALADYEAGVLDPRPSELDSVVDDDEMDVVVEQFAQPIPEAITDQDRIDRLETGVEGDRDLFDGLRDVVDKLMEEVEMLTIWRDSVVRNGCSRCSSGVKKTVVSGGQTKAARQTTSPAVVPALPRATSGTSVTPVGGPSRQSIRRTLPKATVAPAVVEVMATPAPMVTILRRPAYATKDEARVVASFASVAAAGASSEGYSIVKGRKRFAPPRQSQTPAPVTNIPSRSRHLSVRFGRQRDEKYVLPKDVTVGRIRDALNKSLFALNCGAYFSMSSLSKWGDVLLTLAATAVEDIIGYYPSMRESLETLGLSDFTFVRDTEKVKVFVGMVPLSQFGGGWQPSEWECQSAFERLAADIEQSNPGTVVAARPSWAGRLHKLKERKVNNAGLILVLEMSPEVRKLMSAANPRITVAGRPRVCRLWREDNPTVVCSHCQTVGHRAGECRNKPVCAFCDKEHITSGHVCPVMSCRKVGTVCAHVQRICRLCKSVDHFTGFRGCDALRGSSSSPQRLGPSSPVIADHTSVVGVSDVSRGRLRRQAAGRPGTPLATHMVNNGVSSVGISKVMLRSEINPDRTVHNKEVIVPRLDKGKGIARSPSAPADVSRAGGNVTLSQW